MRIICKESFVYGDGYAFGKGEHTISEQMAKELKGNRNVIFVYETEDNTDEPERINPGGDSKRKHGGRKKPLKG
jgi:phosphoribosylformylglycinamidine (FGAM) synthase-like amidotransferase family enzyme